LASGQRRYSTRLHVSRRFLIRSPLARLSSPSPYEHSGSSGICLQLPAHSASCRLRIFIKALAVLRPSAQLLDHQLEVMSSCRRPRTCGPPPRHAPRLVHDLPDRSIATSSFSATGPPACRRSARSSRSWGGHALLQHAMALADEGPHTRDVKKRGCR